MATERLYYSDCYLTDFEANVADLTADGRGVYLDRTAFYPSSGGQPHDLGTLGGQQVLDVVDEEDRILHLTAGSIAKGPSRGQIDWPRRYDHMQQHTGQHLLSAVFMDLFGFQTLSFHMGADISSIELDAKEISTSQIDQVEQQANTIARAARTVKIGFEEASAVEGLRKLSQRSGLLRIVEIEGLDKSACGGTHVRSSAETAPLQIRGSEKLRGHVRIEFVCGDRAVKRAKQDFRVVQDLARQAAVAIDKLPEHFASLKARLSEAEKDRQRLGTELAQREGKELYAATEPSADGIRRVRITVNEIGELGRAKALAFAGLSRAVALVLGEQPPGVLIACSADAGLNAGAILKEVLAQAGGRGGGSATLAQGSLPDASTGQVLAAKLGFH